ncbi:hypothetical protein FRB90_009590 [Tulasnella sp. 427]|nr:hypothetical protein FRB90_009590 [Tulasnella sp. 427]
MYFPFLEARMGVGRMSGNVAGHEAFYKPFGAFEELVEELISHPELWDAEKLRASIHAFMPVLREHLEEEITTLDAAELRKHVTKKDWEEWEKMFMDDHKKNMSFVKGGQLPFINGDSINGDWFPPLPGPLVLLVKYVLYWVHSDWWEFGACDKDKKVKSQFAPYEPPAKVSKL